jgi:hypothetical protein
MLIRYQVRSVSGQTGKPRGILCAVWHLQQSGMLTPAELALSHEVIQWFEENLPNPPTYELDWGKKGISWFREPIAAEMLERLMVLRGLLVSHRIAVDEVRLQIPDEQIIYEDSFQVVMLNHIHIPPGFIVPGG